MDPVTVALLVALASGAGGAAGQQTWGALSRLLRRPFQTPTSTGQDAASSGEAELDALQAAPADSAAAEALAEVLIRRAAMDPGFAAELSAWTRSAHGLGLGLEAGRVQHNQVSGGIQNGPTFVGGEFTGPMTFTSTSDASAP